MFPTLKIALIAIMPLLAPVMAIDAVGYTGNVCNSEEIFEYDDITVGSCIALEGYNIGSVDVYDFASNQEITFFSDTTCSTPVGGQQPGANSDECFVDPDEGGPIMSFMATLISNS